MEHHHVLLLSFPAQSHLNATLQLAKNLARAGACCTFATTVHGLSRMRHRLPSRAGLSYDSFSDGHDDTGIPSIANFNDYLNDLKRVGSDNLKKLILKYNEQGRPVTFIVYALLLPWVSTVAREIQVPSAFLAVQSATTLAIFLHFHTSKISSSFPLYLQDLPPLSRDDVPSFVFSSDSIMFPVMSEHVRNLEEDPNPRVIINTFDKLENSSLRLLEKIGICSIGPLIPLSFDDDVGSFGCELADKSGNYRQWLDSKPEGSVIYVAFGSFARLKEGQEEEILQGLLESGRPFLWVIRSSNKNDESENENNWLKLQGKGITVPWCSQLEVLFHKSIGCFVSHCGWNSTLESITAGVPVIGYPQFSDQLTNIKMIEESWGTGLRARTEEGIVKREELKRCLEIIMGDGEEGNLIRMNVQKYRDSATEAVKVGGSSHRNFNKLFDSL